MTKAKQLKSCDRLLLIITILMLASSIQLEATAGRSVWWVWIHIIVGCCFFANIIWHLYLHFGRKSWIERLRKQKSPVTRLLAIFGLLTIISAIAAFFLWVGPQTHTSPGGWHGKIGFIFIALAIGHTIKRIGFYNRR